MKTLRSALIALLIMVSTILVGQNLRMVQTFVDQEGLHMMYFTEPRAGETPRFLGEEIFRHGEKVFDNYKEND